MQIATRTLVALGAFALVSGCAAAKIYEENRDLLRGSLASLRANRLSAAEDQAVTVLVNTGNVTEEYALQRYFAHYLVTLANLEAYFGRPYLREPMSGAWAGFGADSSKRPSPVGHLVATSYFGTYALGEFSAASIMKLVEEGERLLPPELEELGTEGARVHLELCMLTAYSRLQYQDQVTRILQAIDGATDLATLDALVAHPELASMRPWIYLALFEHLKAENERNAYKFAVRTLESGEEGTGLGERELRGVERWITADSSYVFKCPECPDTEVDVTEPLCPSCGEVDRIDFKAKRRARNG